ncbi:11194_t:CDS:1 [Gigaspora margarita]|uniref:11194_t:CDS:1 n=1 Tax=Gigaspora margarita TaxID=4874 RepID=A0ABN7WN69_GIGMA|nr:11194_t:CDS:1 [Gigaspora margarita]
MEVDKFCEEKNIKSYPPFKYFKILQIDNLKKLKNEDGYSIATIINDPEIEKIKDIDGKEYNGLVILLRYKQSALLSKLKHIFEKSKEDPSFELRLLGTSSGRGFTNIVIEAEKIALRESKN